MTANKRIVVNVIATYGRSLYAMACGLFASRWALGALGQTDYGLYGVVGGLTAFVVFLNALMASAVGRFFAYSIGQASHNEEDGEEECIRWFNVAILVHLTLPVVLIAIGYPLGLWAVTDFLSIPADRIHDCVWVWRFTCLSCFVSMCSVPFQAMFTAKQEIAELTSYSVLTTTLNIVTLYYMASHEGVWLRPYATCMCLTAILPQMVIAIRACIAFPECSFRVKYLWDIARLKRLLAYASSCFVYGFSQIMSVQGMAIVVNKGLGATRNATLTIGNTVLNQTMTLAGSFQAALNPAIANATGAQNFARVRGLAYRACTLSLLAFLLFMLPLSLELDTVLKLWLRNPPPYLAPLCAILFLAGIVDRSTDGCWMAILAGGRIALFQFCEAIACLSAVIVAASLIFFGVDILAVGIGFIVCRFISLIVRLYFGRKLCGISIRYWSLHLILPLLCVSVVALFAGAIVVGLMEARLYRVVVTTFSVEMVFIPLVWFIVLEEGDRMLIKSKILKIIHR